ncbi:PAS domain S-box protein [Roseateles sp. BYS96W]|uniref:histidine kinase n=1 Tax=Pelomonas nitida TaxID=3299027 RepID=A0ABW7G1N8_9BURK
MPRRQRAWRVGGGTYAAAALLLGALLTWVAATLQTQANARERDRQLDALSHEAVAQVSARMRRYEYGLRGARGAIIAAGADRITREDFWHYSQTRQIESEFPGARGFGFIRRVTEAQEPAFVAAARRDGAPDFRIRQFSAHAGDRYVIQYIEPQALNEQAVGLDIASEAARREAADRAVRDGRAVLTRPITLAQVTGKVSQSFLLLLPIYRTVAMPSTAAAREAESLGWSYAPLTTSEVLADLDLQRQRYDLTLTDVTDGITDAAPFYTTAGPAGAKPAAEWARQAPVDVFGRTWLAQVQARPSFIQALQLRPPAELMLEGGAATALFTMLAWFYGQARAKRRAELFEHERRAAMVETAADAFIAVSLDGRITSWNAAAEQMFGYRRDEALGQTLQQLLMAPNDPDDTEQTLEQIRQGAPVLTYDTTRRTRDGHALDVAISVAPMRDENGSVVGMVKTMRDISAAKQAERGLQRLTAELEAKVIERTAGLEAARRDLRNILDALPSVVGYWDQNLHNRFANHAYETWFGQRARRLADKTLGDLLGPALYAQCRPHIDAALRGEPQSFELSLPRPDGLGPRQALAHYLPDIVDGRVHGFYELMHDVTELKESQQQAAAALRDNAFLLDTIRHHAIMSVTDRDGVITDANDAFCAMAGYAREELIGQTHRLVNSGTQGSEFWPDVWRTISAGVAWRGEVCNRARDGSLHWLDSVIAPFVGSDGQVDRYISIRFDITARKQAVAELQATHERLSLATDAAHMGVWELAPDSGALTWDAHMHQLYGQDPATAAPSLDDWLARVHPADVQQLRELLAHCAANGDSVEADFRIIRADGTTRHIRAAAKADRHASGAALRVIGVNWDVTERKRAEMVLAETTSLLRTVLASATDISIIATDPGFTIRVFNQGAENLLGYRSADVVGQASPALIHLPDEIRERARELSATLGRVVRGGDYFREPATHGQPHEWHYRRKDGSTVAVSLTVTAMRDEVRGLLGYLGVARDISAQKRHEEALVDAKAAAEQANLAKSQFLANMSHEIRTPMNAVIGLSYLLEQTRLDAYQSELLTKIAHASKGLLGVINDVLDLSKIEAGELGISLQPFSPGDLLVYLTDVLRVQASTKGVSLELAVACALPEMVVGDSLRVNQVLTNLLGNAVKFTNAGSVRLVVDHAAAATADIRLRFEVHDTGIGIAPEALQHLFQPFAQADGSITRRFGGTGLGLSIVKQLTELMGGTLGVESVPGIGSTFWVELPFTLADAATLQKTAAAAPPSDPQALAGMRILVVDDSEINLEVAKRILEGVGARVALAADGKEAVERLRLDPDGCDLVLMDIHMPVMDGMTATRLIRQQLGLRRLPIVALTAGALASQRTEARHAGMNDFITKPFAPADVIDCIARLVGRPATLRGGGTGRPPPAGWPDIDGIDAAAVAERVDGDLDLFRTLLRHLLAEFESLPAPPADAAGELGALARRLHKLRGSAGNTGATRVQASATRAEQACLRGELTMATQEIAAVNQDLQALRQAASAWLHDEPPPAPVAAQPWDEARLAELMALLGQQHIGAIDCFEAIAPALHERLGGDRFDRLREHIDQLQFAQAAMLLQHLT